MFKAGLALGLIYIGVIIAALVGWIFNVIAFVHMIGGPVTTMFIARLAGIPLAILGAILGYIS